MAITRVRRSQRRSYRNIDRKPTRFANFFGEVLAMFAKEGIGAVGFLSVDAIAPASRSAPMLVSGGPGPLLPLLPI